MLNAGRPQQQETSKIEVVERVYPEGRVYIGTYVYGDQVVFKGDPRFIRFHAEYDANLHLYFMIVGKVDWARQIITQQQSADLLEAKWVLDAYDFYSATIYGHEVKLSEMSQDVI